MTTVLLLSCGSKTDKTKDMASVKDSIPLFEPNWESIKKNYKDPEWFNDQKFGIFIHWGAYAVPAYGSEWYPRRMYMDTATFTAQLNLQKKGPNATHLHHKKLGRSRRIWLHRLYTHVQGRKVQCQRMDRYLQEIGSKIRGARCGSSRRFRDVQV